MLTVEHKIRYFKHVFMALHMCGCEQPVDVSRFKAPASCGQAHIFNHAWLPCIKKKKKREKKAETEGPVWVCTSWTYLRTYFRIFGFLPLLQGLPHSACMFLPFLLIAPSAPLCAGAIGACVLQETGRRCACVLVLVKQGNLFSFFPLVRPLHPLLSCLAFPVFILKSCLSFLSSSMWITCVSLSVLPSIVLNCASPGLYGFILLCRASCLVLSLCFLSCLLSQVYWFLFAWHATACFASHCKGFS